MGDVFGLQGWRDVRETWLICTFAHLPHAYCCLLGLLTSLLCPDDTEECSNFKDFCDLDICYQLPFECITKHSELLMSCLLPLARFDEEANPEAEGEMKD